MLKSRSGSQGSSSTLPPQTIEVVRRRARHRLIGAAILVLVGVLGFPLLFDTEPRPVAGDIPIEIPSRNDTSAVVAKAKEAVAIDEPAAKTGAKPAEAAKVDAPLSAKESLDTREEVVEPVKAAPKAAVVEKNPEVKEAAETKDPAKELAKQKAQAAEAAKLKESQATAAKAKAETAKAEAADAAAESARAKALLEAKTPAGNERLVVQVGAFSDPLSARTTRMKVERAGMTTYTHVADTPSGKLIRVRVGPYGTRAEANKAADKLKALGLPARILAL